MPNKRKSRPKSAPAITESMAQLSPAQLRQFSEALVEVGESFGLNQADWELAMEDQGWLTFGGSGKNQFGTELFGVRRVAMVRRCRLFWRVDPLAKQAVRLWTDYGIGKGISYEVEDDDTSQKALNDFFKHRKNKKLTCSKGQQRLSKKLLIDGDVFFAIFKGEPAVIRTIDPIQITEIITDPDDEESVLCYKRELSGNAAGGAEPKTVYYQDWAFDPKDHVDDDGKPIPIQDPKTPGQPIKLEKNVVVYHLSFDDVGKWGNGLLTSIVDWSDSHRMFMKDRVAITRGLAKFVTKLTVKGGQAAVDAMAKKIQSSLTQTGYLGGYEKNPITAPGSTYLQNAGIDMQATPRATGAGDAYSDGRMLKLQVCAGTGILEHYFGDGAQANLAIATAMEAPMLKMFLGFQELWCDAWQDIFSIVLGEDIDEDPIQVNVSLPKILEEDLLKLGQFLTSLTMIFPELKVEDIMRTCLEALGADDIDGILTAAKAQRKKIDADNAANMKLSLANAAAAKSQPVVAAPPNSAPQNGNGNGNGKSASAAEVEAINRLSLALEEGNRAPAMPPILPEISVHPQIIIANASETKSTVKTARSKREPNGDMTIVIEEKVEEKNHGA